MLKTAFARGLQGTLLVCTAFLLFAPSGVQAAWVDPVAVTYVVQKGDTLKGIAARHDVSLWAILALNEIPDPDSLEIGSELLVPFWDFASPLPGTERDEVDATAATEQFAALARRVAAPSARGGRQRETELIWPLTGPLTQRFIEGGHHKGIDIAAPHGVPVVAAKSGTVRFSGQDNSGYGRYVILDHGDGSSTLYAHFSRLAVDVGSAVAQGEVVGYVGSTGISTGPHLHFELRQNGSLVDPLDVLP